MTTLFSWTGIDTHGPASVYIASDSRISWDMKTTWDVGRKLYASKKYPEIFGYCGSVTFPLQILSQLIDLIDNDFLFHDYASLETKVDCVREEIKRSYGLMPTSQSRSSEVLYATRIGNRMRSSFHVVRICISSDGVFAEDVELPEKSGLIACAGTGKAALNTWYGEWVGLPFEDPHQSGRTSRNVFSAFCDSLESKQDPYSGGAPQLVGLYRVGPAKTFGVIHKEKRFLNGAEVSSSQIPNNMEWRNNLFERCSGESMQILKKAQRQPKLREVAKP